MYAEETKRIYTAPVSKFSQKSFKSTKSKRGEPNKKESSKSIEKNRKK